MDPPVLYIDKVAQLQYIHVFPGYKIFISGMDQLCKAKEVALLLKAAADQHGSLPVNIHEVNDARELDYSLCALEQTLEELLGADADAEAVAAREEDALNFFTTRLSVDRSVCDDDGVRAVVTAVNGVIRAARSSRVQGDDVVAEADLGRVVTAVRGVGRAVVTAVRGVVRVARSQRVEDSSADLVRPAPSASIDGTVADLARAALGEVRAARARPVLLHHDHVRLKVSSVQEAEEVLRAGPPHTRGVWSTACVLDVCGGAQLRDSIDFHYRVVQCKQLGWRVPLINKLGHVKRIDAQLILLNYKLKCLFDLKIVGEDGNVDPFVLDSIGKLTEDILRVCIDEATMFQAEVATLPDIILELLDGPSDVKKIRAMANKAMLTIHRIRSQQVTL